MGSTTAERGRVIVLSLLAAHMLGDFVFQTRWQAELKFTDRGMRAKHVATYAIPFIPIAVAYAPSLWRCIAFISGLMLLHYITDSRRLYSNFGDWLVWQFIQEDEPMSSRVQIAPGIWHVPLPPSQWGPLPMLVDQTLHICQIAALVWLL